MSDTVGRLTTVTRGHQAGRPNEINSMDGPTATLAAAREVHWTRLSEVSMFLASFVISAALAVLLTCAVGISRAAACPEPTPRPDAVLTPDGAANVVTRGQSVACWWTVSEDGDAEIAHHFDLETAEPTEIWWDERRQAICVEVRGADGRLHERTFPLGGT